MKENHFSNRKIALVTGGASGLGYAIAERFVKEDITTILVGRNEEKLIQAKEKLGILCSYFVFDLNNLEGISQLVSNIHRDFGKIDILVNNAGVHLKKPMTEVKTEEFHQVIHTNLTSVFVLTREVVKNMLELKNGTIVNISSMAAKYGIPQVIAYTASKAAIEGMTKAMAVELSPQGIRVNCVAPGFIATNMSAKAFDVDPERKRKVLSRTPMGTLGLPSDVAEAVYYLASEKAGYITGTILTVDGGNSIGF